MRLFWGQKTGAWLRRWQRAREMFKAGRARIAAERRGKGAMTKCGRCGKSIGEKESESCWYCGADLCYDCWDGYGGCGNHAVINGAMRSVPPTGLRKGGREESLPLCIPIGLIMALFCWILASRLLAILHRRS